MGNMENDMANLKDMFKSYLTGSPGLFSGRDMVGRATISNGLREIGKLDVGEECLIGSGKSLGVRK